MSYILKFLAAILILILLALLVLTFGGGPYIRNYINTHGTELLGRKVYAEGISLNGFTGGLTIDSLFIAEKDGTTRFMSARQINTHLNVPRLFLRTYMLDNFHVSNLRLDVLQRDTVFNFSDIIDRLTDDEPESSEPLPLVINDINIHNSYIHYKDSVIGSDFALNDLSLFIPGIDLRDINTSVGIDLSFTDGGSLKTKVDYDDRHKMYSLDIKVNDFNLRSILPYIRQSIYLGDLKGVLNLDLIMRGSVAHLLDFTLKGEAGIKRLDVLDEDGQSMVRCDTVVIGVRDLDLPANRVNLSRVHFDQPYIRIQYYKDSLDNFSRLITKAELLAAEKDSLRRLQLGLDPTEEASEAATDSTLNELLVEYNGHQYHQHLVIDSLVIDSARLSYRDESLQHDPFVYELSNVNILAPNFSFGGINHITANAQLGKEGRMRFWYDGPTVDGRNMHMVVQADNIDVKDFSPYTVQMFGNEVSRGTMSVNLMYDTKDGNLIGQNRIIIRDPKVEKRRRDVDPEMRIPFRTGVYLLTDKNDVLDVDIPVKGNIEEPQFSYKRIMFRTLGKLLVKVCSSPFRRNRSHDVRDILHDTRSLDDINLDSISSDLLNEE